MPVAYKEHGFLKDHAWVIYVVIMITAAINGWGASLVWNGQGSYITKCCSHENHGLYNGILWIGGTSAFITGNLMAAFLVTKFSNTLFYIIMTGLCVASTFYFMCLPTPHKVADDHHGVDEVR
jgi:hypothetical protein